MSEKSVQITTVKKGVAKTNPIRLAKTANTVIRFESILHNGGVTGRLVKYKKTSAKSWSDVKETDFKSHSLGTMEKVVFELDTTATTKLFEELKFRQNIVEQGIQNGQTEYIFAPKDEVLVINDSNKHSILKQILHEDLSDDYWKLIAESQPELANRLAQGHIQHLRTKTVNELKKRLTEEHSETAGPISWQPWIYRNHWLFGINYQQPLEKQKINIQGVMPDYLFPTIDGFVDILEIKLPKHEVLKSDSNHPGSYRWTTETTKAIGQVTFYLSEIERQQLEIEKNIYSKLRRRVSMLKPRAFILIGDSDGWSDHKREGLRRLNHALHGIEVITYRQLVYRGEAFLNDPTINSASDKKEFRIPF